MCTYFKKNSRLFFITLERNWKFKFSNLSSNNNVKFKKNFEKSGNLFLHIRKNNSKRTIQQLSENNTAISDGMFLRVNKKWKNFRRLNESSSINDELYSPLHNHSDLSLLDGASRVSEMVKFTKELNIKSLSVTDHGVMHATVDLF